MTTYRSSGVDQSAADALIPRYAAEAARTRRGDRVTEVGGFAGAFPLTAIVERGYRRPTLAVSTDTTGTKIELLRKAGHHRTAGWDCVAMNADDVVCTGAEPLLFVDCIATERLDPDEAAEIVAGVADGCVEAGCELIGGETAQLPGLLAPAAYEVMGTCVGVVDADEAWGPHRVVDGDVVVGLASSGLHSNGFSLVRKVLGDEAPPPFVLEPTAIYARRLLALAETVAVHACAHVTGGGIADNLDRVLPQGAEASIDWSSWERPEVFDWLAGRGVDEDEMRRTFNCGLGMLLVVGDGDAAVSGLGELGTKAWTVGAVSVRG